MALQDPVAIYMPRSMTHAEEIRLLLAHCDVEAFVEESSGFGETIQQIWVSRSDAPRATELIDAFEVHKAEQPESDDDSEPEENHCLACGEVIPEEVDRCQMCGWSYEATSSEG